MVSFAVYPVMASNAVLTIRMDPSGPINIRPSLMVLTIFFQNLLISCSSISVGVPVLDIVNIKAQRLFKQVFT